ncbi:MotA/TolQ/ExbB proton channel family protein [Caballeronia sp. LZ043]|uniref:MotA/TolQ/ExbB proton channel family protein n=1 Tax=Caballeronia sp. LZ043 TaxID=3038569 RepID=UPI00285A2CA1|nr:MotA/TolQ/ExbB proton channel family protein [Caballeronia sp. LZ043]MDR5825732.1 MotA/TolQ/ExbB proton channel family protein [Caballeronia sp. LZ043]
MQTYGMAHVWAQGDFITRGILVVLLLMSVTSWTVIAVKYMNVLRLKRLMCHAERTFWDANDFSEGVARLATATPSVGANPFLALALSGLDAADHHQLTQTHLHDRLDVSDWITRNLRATMDDCIAHLQSGLAVLASIGSTSPFVGLFGTVWGIYHAMLTIGASGQASIDQVAGPVGEALIMTAFGLCVAIPAVLGYNALNSANKSTVRKLNRFAHSLHAFFVTGVSLVPSGHAARQSDGLSTDL